MSKIKVERETTINYTDEDSDSDVRFIYESSSGELTISDNNTSNTVTICGLTRDKLSDILNILTEDG